MRSEQEMMELILSVAREDDRILGVYMNGSRVNKNVPKDSYQDYDIVYAVKETQSFLDNASWIETFGEIAMVQEPDSNDLGFGMHKDFSKRYAWLILLQDGNRIDLTIEIVKEAQKNILEDPLTMVLLDKKEMFPTLASPNDNIYHVQLPDKAQFRGCCNEFWWCLNNVAKGINREELSYVMEMYHHYVRAMLHKMMEWSIGIRTDFSVSVGKMGKFFKLYLTEEELNQYKRTYSDGEYQNIWKAVFVSCDLFSKLAREVAEHFTFIYEEMEEKNMLLYLTRMKKEKETLDETQNRED